ncbi:MAG: RNA polymerase sigma factor [Actinobacteria bacterium]|nr:RNA polymerase sigma factor [Actinomycetota bacterium]MBV8598347.1 RNA polymerase sigma factor [Actinomycetota bacterium]
MSAVPRPLEEPAAAATRDLYERYRPQILAFCLVRLRNREEAEDATQATFLNAMRGLQRGVSPEFETAWLYKIAHNVCLTRRRSAWRRSRVETPGDIDAMQDVLASPQHESDELLRLPDALALLPEQQRRALLLREWQGLSYREVAEELGLSQSAVETLLFRARRSLARALEEEPPRSRRRIGSLGSVIAGLKMLLVGGGAKVAATVATVAATSLVVSAPPARHDLERLLAADPRGVPLAAVEAPKPRPKPAPVVVAPAPPVAHAVVVVTQPHRVAVVHARREEPKPEHHAAVVHHVEKPRPIPPPAPAPPVVPAAPTVAEDAPPSPDAQPTQPHDDGNGNGNAHGHDHRDNGVGNGGDPGNGRGHGHDH